MNKFLFGILLICLFDLNNDQTDPTPLHEVLKNDVIVSKYKNFIFVSNMQCGGCMYEKLDNFYLQATPSQKSETLFLLDTNNNQSATFIQTHFNYFYIPQDSLEKHFPLISNFILIIRKGDRISFKKEFDTLGSDSDIVSYLPRL
ncbi:MAG: hypothetical protein ACTHJ0_00940 [Flavipsychrobacter sp.]